MQALYHLTKTLDPTRPVIGNDGWESVATDIIGIHDYDDDPSASRGATAPTKCCRGCSSASGRAAACWCSTEQPHAEQPIDADRVRRHRLLATDAEHAGATRGARQPRSSPSGTRDCSRPCASLPLLAGFCYTQFADTYQEANGLLYADRTPKIPLERIARGDPRAAPTAADGAVEPRSRPRRTTDEPATMHKRALTQAGRPRADAVRARADRRADSTRRRPVARPHAPNAHLRWHPLRGEWVAYATHRQDRTFLPPPEYNPLAPTTDPAHPTEVPAGD